MLPNNGLPVKFQVTSLLLAAVIAAAAATVNADEKSGTASSPITHEQGNAILNELKAIRGLLEKIRLQGPGNAGTRPDRPTTATIKLDKDNPVLGSVDAPVTIVEFTDFQCPYCKRFFQTTFSQLKRSYIDTGKVRWIVRDLPMSFHPDARKAGQAAHCAGEQGKYREMREILFGNSPKLETARLPKYAQVVGLDVAAFNTCLASERHLADIDKDRQAADSVRITGTPTFIIGKSNPDSLTGLIIVGAQAQSVFTATIDRLLEPAGKE